MRTRFIILFFCWLPLVLLSQENNKIIWIKPENNGLNDNNSIQDGNRDLFNFHKRSPRPEVLVKRFVNSDSLNFNQLSIITTFHLANTPKEQIIWSLEKENESQCVLTTHRTANFQKGKYLNYGDNSIFQNKAQIQSYFVNNRNGQYDQIRIGTKSPTPVLPIENFTGMIPEILVFDEILSFDKIRQIESYLAIKYGVSLNQYTPTNYSNSQGAVIWDAVLNKEYPFNITGIGKDDYFGLNQKQSTSINQPYLLSIGWDKIYETNQENPSQIPNNNYLIWSDDNGRLEFEPDELSLSQNLKRKWVMNANLSDDTESTSIQLDVDQIKSEIDFEHQYWLKVDKSGTGTFPIEHTELFKGTIQNNKANFHGINWSDFNKNRTAFTFSAGPALMPLVEVVQPQCKPNKDGGLSLKVFGGKAPYQIEIRKENTLTIEALLEKNQTIQFEDLVSGNYHLLIKDRDGIAIQKTFYLQSSDAPKIDLQATYYLAEGESIQLNGNSLVESVTPNLSYQWQGNNGFNSPHSQIEIKEAGSYQLTVAEDECISKYNFEVKSLEEEIFERIEVFPNPISENTLFKAKIKLKEPSPLQVTITDSNGRIIREKNYDSQDYFLYTEQITVPGHYFLTFATQKQKTSRAIIIH